MSSAPIRPDVAGAKAAHTAAAAKKQSKKRKTAPDDGAGSKQKKKKSTPQSAPSAPAPSPAPSQDSTPPSSPPPPAAQSREPSSSATSPEDDDDTDDEDSGDESASTGTSPCGPNAKIDWSTAMQQKRHPLNKGTRHFVRTCAAFEPIGPILHWGLYYDWTVEQQQECEMTLLERKYTDLWLDLKRLVPDLRGAIEYYGVDLTATLMTTAATNARGEDAKKVKDALPILHAWDPTLHGVIKTKRGFFHDAVAILLCPTHDKANLEKPEVLTEYQHGVRQLDPKEWPPFMYYKHIIHDDNVWRGLCKSDLGTNAGKVVFTGKSSVYSKKRSGKSTAAKNGMRQMTLPAISWVMTLTFFALSSDSEFTPSDLDGGFSYMNFYNSLLASLENEDEGRRNKLLAFWTDKLFACANTDVVRPAGVIPSTERLLLAPPREDDDDLDY